MIRAFDGIVEGCVASRKSWFDLWVVKSDKVVGILIGCLPVSNILLDCPVDMGICEAISIAINARWDHISWR